MILKLPLDFEVLGELLKDKEKLRQVSYVESTYKSQAFLNFISNLGLNIEISDFKDIPSEQKVELLEAYIKNNQTKPVQTISFVLAQILLAIKGAPLCEDLISDKEMELFVSRNPDILSRLLDFFDSLIFNVVLSLPGGKDQLNKLDEVIIVDEKLGIESLIEHLLFVPDFAEAYIAHCKEPKHIYFEIYVEDYLFSGSNLFGLLERTDSSIFTILGGIATGKLTPERFLKEVYNKG